MRFPLIGSAVLFSLFLLFKVLPKVRAGRLSCTLNAQSLIGLILSMHRAAAVSAHP